MTTIATPPNAIFFGEALIDLVRRGDTFSWHPGGAPANAAVAARRHGARSALIASVGADSFGDDLYKSLLDAGVDCRGVRRLENYSTSLAVAATNGSTAERFTFYRSADLQITRAQASSYDFTGDTWFVFGSLSLCNKLTAESVRSAIRQANEVGAKVFFDANYRASLWPSTEGFRRMVLSLPPLVDVLKVNLDEAAALVSGSDPSQAAAQLQRLGFPVVILTLGHRGCLVRSLADIEVQGPPMIGNKGDPIGTGDAFVGSFVAHVLRQPGIDVRTLAGRDLVESVRQAQLGAIFAAQRDGAGWDNPRIVESAS
jgi:fructokinase